MDVLPVAAEPLEVIGLLLLEVDEVIAVKGWRDLESAGRAAFDLLAAGLGNVDAGAAETVDVVLFELL